MSEKWGRYLYCKRRGRDANEVGYCGLLGNPLPSENNSIPVETLNRYKRAAYSIPQSLNQLKAVIRPSNS
jgi:hypothetical protein